MDILLFGPSGQVGWELGRSLAPLGRVRALDRHALNRSGDLQAPDAVANAIRSERPQVVVNAAAYTAVDRAEADEAQCRVVNADAPAAMARACADVGAWLVHYSTDYVFDGSGSEPWREDDAPAPLNAYGRSKLAGEEAIRASGAKHLVFRTSWVYGAHGSNFLKTMLRLGQERDRLDVVDDQRGAPTGAELIADATAHAIHAAIGDPSLGGTYHLAAAGETSWRGYAETLLIAARALGLPVKAEVRGVGTDAYPTPARRPHNSRLSTQRLTTAFGLRMPPWQTGVERVVRTLAAGRSV